MAYQKGDYRAICDLCGLKKWASECRKTWDGLFVCADTCWQPRHPQDIIFTIAEDTSVPIARSDITQAVASTTVKTAAVINDKTVTITSITGISDGDPIEIVLDNGASHCSYSDGTPASYIVTLGSPMTGNAAVGNAVYLMGINNETYITTTGISATQL